jgi:hypothetical protein
MMHVAAAKRLVEHEREVVKQPFRAVSTHSMCYDRASRTGQGSRRSYLTVNGAVTGTAGMLRGCLPVVTVRPIPGGSRNASGQRAGAIRGLISAT